MDLRACRLLLERATVDAWYLARLSHPRAPGPARPAARTPNRAIVN
jgi:hypothetical protein